jgi:hypothetical protein
LIGFDLLLFLVREVCCRPGGARDAMGEANRVCNAVRYSGVVISLAVFIYCLALLVYVTPLYSPIVCVEGEKRFGDAVVNAALDIPGELELECKNPNKYAISIRTSEVGRVTAIPDNVEIGQCKLDHHMIPAGGSDLSLVHLNLSIPMDFVMKLYEKGYSEIFVDVGVKAEMSIGLLPPLSMVSITAEVDKMVVCAMTIGSTLPVKTGSLICGDSREALKEQIPPLQSDGERIPFGFSAPEAFISRYQKAVPILGSICSVSFALALMLLRFELVRLLRCLLWRPIVAEISPTTNTADIDAKVANDAECGENFENKPRAKSDKTMMTITHLPSGSSDTTCPTMYWGGTSSFSGYDESEESVSVDLQTV